MRGGFCIWSSKETVHPSKVSVSKLGSQHYCKVRKCRLTCFLDTWPENCLLELFFSYLATLYPNMQLVGKGYNLLKGDPLSPVSNYETPEKMVCLRWWCYYICLPLLQKGDPGFANSIFSVSTFQGFDNDGNIVCEMGYGYEISPGDNCHGFQAWTEWETMMQPIIVRHLLHFFLFHSILGTRAPVLSKQPWWK